MARIILLTLLSLGILSANYALAEDTPDTEMIVGGKPARDGKFPYQVRLYETLDDEKGHCGGSIVGPQWVLTAAHCVVTSSEPLGPQEAAKTVFVGYGSTDRTKTTKIESELILVHPRYLEQALTSGADVALIKLKEPIPDAAPIEFANPESEAKFLTRGAKVTVTGWGAIWDPDDKEVVDLLAKITPQEDVTDKLKFPLKLHEAEINVMDRKDCRAIYEPQKLSVADSEICALKLGSVTNSCYGDSGGPLVIKAHEPKRYVQIGIVSWGDRCGRVGNPNVFARVAIFADWIEQAMSGDGAASVMSGAP